MAGFATKIFTSSARIRSVRLIATPLAALALCVAFAAPAGAADGAAGLTGGSNVVIVPKLAKIQCLRACAGKRGIQAGSLIRITGENLAAVGQVIFLGTGDAADDTTAPVIKAGASAVSVRVPADTASGPLVVVGANGARSKPSAPVAVRPLPPVIGTPDLTTVTGFNGPPGVSLETGTSTPRVVFFGAKQLVRFSLRVNGAAATAAITLIRQSTGETITSWSLPAPAGQIVSVDWNGMAGALPATFGRYAFRVSLDFGATAPVAATSASPANATDSRDAFDLYGYVFPVRGKHNFGQYAARFGGGRGHQGQDVLAACGTRLVAARGGTVIASRFQAAAGNFLVIRPDFAVGDNAYMHLVSPSPFKPGDHVYTGQTIGNVGRTGDATACHLHFEQWTGNIWTTHPIDPLPELLAWNQIS